MSTASGITISEELSQAFTSSLDTQDIRFIKAIIRNESIMLAGVTNVSGDLDSDLSFLQDLLEDNSPAYVLAKLDTPLTAWLAISYVPDTAKVRDKMLYASSRASLTKSLGSSYFVDSLFATSKGDLTATAYKRHIAHNMAPKPLSAHEKEIEDIKAAEREAGGTHEGSMSRRNHIGTGVMFPWESSLEQAVQRLKSSDTSTLIVMGIDLETEKLILLSADEYTADDVGSKLPRTSAAYALFLWCHKQNEGHGRDLLFIYSCPSTSPVKQRMLYSSGVSSVMQVVQQWCDIPIAKRFESSDPEAIDIKYITKEMGYSSKLQVTAALDTEKLPFAKPKGPIRKRQ